MIDLFTPNSESTPFKIETLDFDQKAQEKSSDLEYGSNWPVVYVIHKNGKSETNRKIYIGETSNFSNRFKNHLDNEEKQKYKFEKISFMYDGFENKSVVLDYEASLIRLCCAEENLEVINKNYGQSQSHQYFARNVYRSRVKSLWDTLKKNKIVFSDYEKVVNANLFKYSPYTDLTQQQYDVAVHIMEQIVNDYAANADGKSFIVQGGAGTGKTLLAIKMIYTLLNYERILYDYETESDLSSDEELKNKFDRRIIGICQKLFEQKRKLKIGFIIPQQSLRIDLIKVFKNIDNLSNRGVDVIFSPGGDDFGSWEENHFDVLFVDEAHRLKHGRTPKLDGNGFVIKDKNGNAKYRYDCIKQSQCKNFKDACNRLYSDELKGLLGKERNNKIFEKNQLDVLLKCSKHLVLFYDENQRVTTNDVTHAEFEESIRKSGKQIIDDFKLETQLRCGGGNSFVNFVNSIFEGKAQSKFESNIYEFKMFESADLMHARIKELNEQVRLCRMAAGYAWPWKLKAKANELKTENESEKMPTIRSIHLQYPELKDIEIEGSEGFIWNTQDKGWIASPNSVNEVGCIHTTQGYDLNYIGLIIGPDLTYDEKKNKIVAVPEKNYDTFKREGEVIDEQYIVNAYKTMLFRGVLGCFIYVCDEKLRNYLKKYVNVYGKQNQETYDGEFKQNLSIAAESVAEYDASRKNSD